MGGALKKPTPAPAPPAAVSSSTGVAALSVTTQSKRDEIGIQTLVGDYKETGTNHGKKVYQKMQKIVGHEDIKVFLYYWDQRDGADFSGWWFGDQVGGSQVWARCVSHGPAPPRTGWRIPWDSPKAEPGLLSVDPVAGGRPSPSSAGANAPASAGGAAAHATSSAGGAARPGGAVSMTPAQAQAKVSAALEKVEGLEAAIKEAMASSKTLTPSTDSKVAQEVLNELQKQNSELMEFQKSLTQDISELRRAGPSVMASATEMTKLSPRLRTLQTQINPEMSKLRGMMSKAVASAADAKKKAETEAVTKAQEEKDGKEFQESFPATQELVTTSEDAAEAVVSLAAPLIAEPPEDSPDLLQQAMEEIEAAANDAMEKITEARKDINLKLGAARKFAPETRKLALNEYGGLQAKLTEAQKKLNPYKNFQKEFRPRVEARKHLSDLAETLSSAELEVEKASMMSSAAEHGQMSEDEISSVEKVAQPAKAAIENAMKTIEQKYRTADGAMKDELNTMKSNALGFKKAVDTVSNTLRRQRESLKVREMLQTAATKVDAADESLKACQEAEMPFLKGIEILPAEESSTAIKESEAAAVKTERLVNEAKNFLRTKLAEAKQYVKELSTSVTEELTAHQTRLDATSKKLAAFKKETSERKMSAMLAEVVEAVMDTEKKVEVATKAAEIFTSESLESVSIDALKEAIEKTGVAEKEASEAMLAARKVYSAKQREAKGPDAVAALGKLQGRINDVQAELAKAKRAAASGDKLIKGKEVLAEEDKKIKEVEDEVNKAKRKVKPDEEQAALGIEASKPSDEEVETMTTSLTAGQKTLKAASRTVEAHLAGAPPTLKALLQKLVDRCKTALSTITEILALTKDQRERVMSEAYVREATEKCKEVEAGMEKINEAELPFIKGLEVLPLQEATNATKASEEAAAAVHSAISSARTLIASRNLEVKHYGEAAAKSAGEEFAKLTERINQAASRVATFKKETENRKKTAMMQEAGLKVTSVEEEAKKLTQAAEPFTKEGEKDESDEATDKLVSQLKTTQAAIEETKKFLSARQKDAQGNESHAETLKGLNKRMSDAQADIAKLKKIAAVYEAKFVARKAIAEAQEKLTAMEEEVKKAKEAAAPLIEEAGERFLVAASVRTLAQAWRDHMKAKDLTHEALFAEVAKGADGITKDAFVALLEKLPEALQREEIAFNEARREAMFKQIDADGDGKISKDEFKNMFKQRFLVVKEITLTDGMDVAKSKAVAKLEGGEILETYQGSQKEESRDMFRIECTVVETGATGFVTMQGNQGTKFIELMSPLAGFSAELSKTVDASLKAVQKTNSFFSGKMQELNSAGKDEVLRKASAELTKLKGQVSAANSELQKLKSKIAEGKTELAKKEKKEANAHIEAKERKQADAILAPAIAKIETVEASLASLEEATKTLVSLSEEEVGVFATPNIVTLEAEKLLQALTKNFETAKEVVAAQMSELPKVEGQQGAMLMAKRELLRMSGKLEGMKQKGQRALDAVRAKCQVIVDAKSPQISNAMRAEMLSKDLTIERYFLQLVRPGDDKITPEAFTKHVEGLPGEKYKPEHIGLVCQHIEAGGIGRRKFQAFLQQYFKVVKGIAITDDFEISTAKTLRKADADEIIELLEGPREDEKVGLKRIRGKSLLDGQTGWISLKGNQGTPFLTAVEKPYYACKAEIPMDKDFMSDGEAGVVRKLKADEVLELLEGPKKVTFEPGVRVKGKAISDGAMGWFTAKDKTGTVFAEADSKYYSCVASVAITDDLDIKNCKVVRKLAVNELFTVEEGPIEEKEAGITRVKGKCIKDETIGWVTIKGNAGTKYAEPSSKHFCVLQDVPLTKLFPSAACGDEVRVLAKGEAMQVIEGPKQETYKPDNRVKVKALSDSASGWITLSDQNTRPWTPFYKCKVASPMHKTLALEGAEVVRDVAVGEVLEMLEGPSEDGKVLRIKARAEMDGEVGWVTVRDAEGKPLFHS